MFYIVTDRPFYPERIYEWEVRSGWLASFHVRLVVLSRRGSAAAPAFWPSTL